MAAYDNNNNNNKFYLPQITRVYMVDTG